ncbi:MAG: tRNA (adenosine(37)-N6)-threonylcarbamoyltransferase complex transferase subunit TsaD [Maricaulaceae bacterium]
MSETTDDAPIILGIESSCDETAASLVTYGSGGDVKILSSIIASQDEAHAPYGGVVPEIAARAHMQKIDGIIKRAVESAGVDYTDISAVAATAGPGLMGGVITGLMAGKGLALSLGVPFMGINHLEGHALSPRLAAPCPFPYLLLLISGGHTQLISVNGLGDYHRLGSTVDDAAGEAFDKTAKHMGLGFPGGPRVEKLAKNGDPKAYQFPRPFKGKPHADFSFAGLKTAVARAFDASDKTPQTQANIAASFQQAVCETFLDRCKRAIKLFKQAHPDVDRPYFVVAGGVAANQKIRETLIDLSERHSLTFLAPPLKYCTDNAAMIALAGLTHFTSGEEMGDNLNQNLNLGARPRWPLDEQSAARNPASGFGKKGPKS